MVPQISTNPIELDVVAGEACVIKHSLGRQVAGWLVVWATEHVLFSVADASADTSKELRLIPNVSARVRFLLL